MRKTSELLQVVLDNMDKFSRCLCDTTTTLIVDETISINDMSWIDEYVRMNNSKDSFHFPFLFEPHDKDARIEWLKMHINLCKLEDD